MICNTSICKYLVKFVVSKARDTLGWAKKKTFVSLSENVVVDSESHNPQSQTWSKC